MWHSLILYVAHTLRQSDVELQRQQAHESARMLLATNGKTLSVNFR